MEVVNMDGTTTVIESQVDWISATGSSDSACAELSGLAHRVALDETERGWQRKAWALLAYAGYRCGRVAFGESDRGVLVQLSGQMAAEQAEVVDDVADRITRVDIAVTVRLDGGDLGLGLRTYGEVVAYRRLHPRSSRPSLIQDGDGGCTVYVGSRQSSKMLRLYNKEAESRASQGSSEALHYSDCWRYELEVKAPDAGPYLRAVVFANDTPLSCAAVVFAWCLDHGVIPAFDTNTPRVLVPGFRRRSDLDSRALWLGTSVRPAVTWMRQYLSSEEIQGLLGLD
jgi:hypothetical protein